MNLKVSFTWIGLVIFALPMLINIAYVVFPPAGNTEPAAAVPRWLELVEQFSRIAYLFAVTLLVSRDTGKKKAKDFSLGMRQRLGIAIALAGSPDFLVLDEPVNGLDPQGIIEMRELILKLNRERGITVLISSHILDELSRLATHYGFIDGGHMVREMSAAELESCCRKCMRMEVSDTRALSRVLDRMQAEYRIADETHADVYAELPVTELVLALAEAHCTVRSIKERDESLESFYMNLIGGEHHA